ncbi:MAG: transporter [Dysgonamonadaceae bacterium]|nr:transporter [Dysgonamonadaceae bacterium]MDD3900552.1 transporter [Dysgonamonadaceae bacterium]MDD4399069.1 transporter [Dysgonamonadaceae bacterium]MEA5082481.1 transporter [Dysgonamonadaceae bacterium]
MQNILERYILPIAMVIGITLHKQLYVFSPFLPILISLMLFITYSRISWKDIQLTKFHYILLSIQYLGSAIVYLILQLINESIAQAVMICILASTATSAPVIAGILGGNIATVAGYSMISNITLSVVAPIFLSWIGNTGTSINFIESFWLILLKVLPVLILPLVLVLSLRKITPIFIKKVRSAQNISFYLWAISLTIVFSQVTQFVISHHNDSFILEITIALASLITCLLQFYFGRKIGRKFDRTIAGGQGLGQKNTVLAIWLTQTYLNPIATLGPGTYVLWQNLVNSWQIWKKKHKDNIEKHMAETKSKSE